MSPGELEKKQEAYAKQALEMAKRGKTMPESPKPKNIIPSTMPEVQKSKNIVSSTMPEAQKSKNIVSSTMPESPKSKNIIPSTMPESSKSKSIVVDNSDKTINISAGKSHFVESENVNKELNKMVEEKIIKTEKQEEQNRFGDLDELRTMIEKELQRSARKSKHAPSKAHGGEKLEALFDIKTVIENEIEILRQKKKPRPPVIVVEEPQINLNAVIVEEPQINLKAQAVVVKEAKVSPQAAVVVEEPRISPQAAVIVEEPRISPQAAAVIVEEPTACEIATESCRGFAVAGETFHEPSACEIATEACRGFAVAGETFHEQNACEVATESCGVSCSEPKIAADCEELIDVRKIAGRRRAQRVRERPPNFTEYINKHNERVDSRHERGGERCCEHSRNRGKKNRPST